MDQLNVKMSNPSVKPGDVVFFFWDTMIVEACVHKLIIGQNKGKFWCEEIELCSHEYYNNEAGANEKIIVVPSFRVFKSKKELLEYAASDYADAYYSDMIFD